MKEVILLTYKTTKTYEKIEKVFSTNEEANNFLNQIPKDKISSDGKVNEHYLLTADKRIIEFVK